MNVFSYLFYSLLLKLTNNKMKFSFILLELPNKRKEKYFKIIHFILFPRTKLWLILYTLCSLVFLVIEFFIFLFLILV